MLIAGRYAKVYQKIENPCLRNNFETIKFVHGFHGHGFTCQKGYLEVKTPQDRNRTLRHPLVLLADRPGTRQSQPPI